MAAATSRSTRTMELQLPRRWKDREITSPERTKIWTEPSSTKARSSDRRVPVIYYLSRNGQLEHPHFMEVPLFSPDGCLYLKDVINRLNFLRGKGIASLYSWSSKRSYKNGYVWHDLSENDFIYPAHGQEYILKGSELPEGGQISKSDDTVMYAGTIKPPPEPTRKSEDDRDFAAASAAARRRRHQSWSAFDIHEYKVYSGGESTGRAAADASTQTDDKRRRRRAIREIEEVDEGREMKEKEPYGKGNHSTELSTDEISEISPPPSDSSPETLETLMKADGRIILRPETVNEDPTPNNNNNNHLTGRGKASTVLMQLLSCGSIGFRDCGPAGQGKENGFSLVSHYKVRLPRGGGGGRGGNSNNQVEKDAEDDTVSSLASGFGGRLKLEDKEYFSGSFIETKKDQFPALKRSSSYNADRTSQMEIEVKEMEGSRARCIPRKPKSSSTKKELNRDLSCSTSSSSITSSSQHGSKRISVQL